MKNNINILAIFCLLIVITGCSVDNFEPEGYITEDNAIVDQETAQIMLNGIYITARDSENNRESLNKHLMFYGLEATPGEYMDQSSQLFLNNNVKPAPIESRGGLLYTFYLKSYASINLANFFINKLETGVPGIREEAKNRMLAEAKTVRASTHFYLLKTFGQFYDLSSEYGIIASNQVIDGFTTLPRNNVKDTYALIVSDLEFAREHATEDQKRFYVTKSYAQALLGKVYLYMGGNENYGKSVDLLESVVNSGNIELEESFGDIFKKGFDTKELIFGPYYKGSSTGGGNPFGDIFGGGGIPDLGSINEDDLIEQNQIEFTSDYLNPSDYLKMLADEEAEDKDLIIVVDSTTCITYDDGTEDCEPLLDDDGNVVYEEVEAKKYDARYQFTYIDELSSNTTQGYNKYPTTGSTYIHMRMGEVYLMLAEALARTGNGEQAIEALNKIRTRAGLEEKVFTDKATLLEDIRKEKLLELNLEAAEPWFDMVRYDRLGDINVADIKPTLSNTDKLIFPIPLSVLANNPKFGKQNPGY